MPALQSEVRKSREVLLEEIQRLDSQALPSIHTENLIRLQATGMYSVYKAPNFCHPPICCVLTFSYVSLQNTKNFQDYWVSVGRILHKVNCRYPHIDPLGCREGIVKRSLLFSC